MGGCVWRDLQGSQARRSGTSLFSSPILPFLTSPQFGVYEWCMTDTWDPANPQHKELAHQIELGNGIPEMRPLRLARQALKTVGFEIEHEEDLADRPDPIPWYYPLEGDISKAQTFWDYITVWRMSWSGQIVTHNAVRVMEMLGLVPKGTHDVGESLRIAGEALVKGGQTKVCCITSLGTSLC
jgi:sterol 24-C-methyltransferase